MATRKMVPKSAVDAVLGTLSKELSDNAKDAPSLRARVILEHYSDYVLRLRDAFEGVTHEVREENIVPAAVEAGSP